MEDVDSMTKQVDQFFRADGSLIHIPAKDSKKIEVLNRIAVNFSPGITYPERELNEILAKFHSDTAALRRHMIQFGILERDNASNYWLAKKD